MARNFPLSYDSGSGNGPFGFGWSLSIPSITRKTDKGLPQYRDAEESDVFILSGAEDLVPVLVDDGKQWRRETLPPRMVDGNVYKVQRYRPCIEGLFARIERWTRILPVEAIGCGERLTTGRTLAKRPVFSRSRTSIASQTTGRCG